ncbi:MAG: DUF6612 family protein [Candidatus Limivivens sp.]|nr:DUF6612 family protein [Candidatus Limivivens sp.]
MRRKYLWLLLTGVLLTGAVPFGAFAEETAETAEMTEAAAVQTEVSEKYTPGDPVDLTKEALLEKTEEAFASTESVRTELDMDMQIHAGINGGTESSGLQMSMDMLFQISMAEDAIFEPYAAYQTVTMSMEAMGMSETEFSQAYIRDENGRRVKYEGIGDEGEIDYWYRSEEGGEDQTSFVDSAQEILEDAVFVLDDHKVLDEDGREYYLLTGQVELGSVADEESIQEKVVEMVDEIAESFGDGEMEFPETVVVKLYVSADDLRLREMTMDLSGIKGTAEDEGMTTDMEFTTLWVSCRLSDYNQIPEIVFPENLDQEPETEEETWEVLEDTEEETWELPETEWTPETWETEISLEKYLGVSGIRATEDLSMEFTDRGTVPEDPAGLNEMGKVYFYNVNSDMYEQVGVCVTGIIGGAEAAEMVEELTSPEDSFYSFEEPGEGEEYRILEYDLYLTEDMTDTEYGFYWPNCLFDVVGTDGGSLEYHGDWYYANVYDLYEDDEEYHPGDTAHCQAVLIMPEDMKEYLLKFGPYGLEYYYVSVS